MSTNENAITNEPSSSPAPSVLIQLRDDVALYVKNEQTGGTIRDKVISHLVEAEVKRRSDLIVKGLEAIAKTEKEMSAKPDHKIHMADGTIIEAYTDAAKKKLDKVAGVLKKQNAALTAAIDRADYSQLANLVNNKGDMDADNNEKVNE